MSTWRYDWGYWYIEDDTMLVRIDDATFQRHLQAELKHQGVDGRTYLQLLEYVDQVLDQRIQVARLLQEPDYWRNCTDSNVYILLRGRWRK